MILIHGRMKSKISANNYNVDELVNCTDVESLTASERGYIPYLKVLLILKRHSKYIEDFIDQIQSIIDNQEKVN